MSARKPFTPTSFPEVSDAIDPRTKERAHWPIEPLFRYLLHNLGEYNHRDNPHGYCSVTAEQLTGIHRTSWNRYMLRGYLTAKQIDEVTTRLGMHPAVLWPDYWSAVELEEAG